MEELIQHHKNACQEIFIEMNSTPPTTKQNRLKIEILQHEYDLRKVFISQLEDIQ